MRARFALFVAVGLWWSNSGGIVSAFTTKKSDRPTQRPAFTVNSPLDDSSAGAATTRTDATTTTTAKRDQTLPLPERAFYSASGTAARPENSNQQNAGAAPFGVNGAAVAYGPYYYYTQQLQNAIARDNDEDEDEELITIGTAVVSCLLSLILGFGLGYGT
jgi:hypothetical protein